LFRFEFFENNKKCIYSKLGANQARAVIDGSTGMKEMKAAMKNKELSPVLCERNPGKYLGAVSEKFEEDLRSYLKNSSTRQRTFKRLMYLSPSLLLSLSLSLSPR